jgi:mono/diheme cytochrome c family protein
MRAIVIISLLFVLALVLFLLAQLGVISSFRFKADHGNGVQPAQQKAVRVAEVSREAGKTNPPGVEPGGFYIGKGDQQVYVNYATHDPVLKSFMQSVMESSSGPNAKGREIFQKICAACHQRDGEGKDGVAPPLVGSEWVLAPGGGRLVRIVLNGVKGPLQVRGRDWNLVMPPWRENLDDDQVAVVLTYVRSQLGTNHAAAVTPGFVAGARQNMSAATETSEELLRISDR